MVHLRYSLVICLALTAWSGLDGGWHNRLAAQDRPSAATTLQDDVASGRIKSLASLRAIVLEQFPGAIVSSALVREHNMDLYEFRVLQKDGRLVEVEVDARSGAIREVEND